MAKKVKKDAYKHSIMTDDLEHCYFCGRTPVQFHHVFGGSNRNASTDDDFFIPICIDCHIKIHNDANHSGQMNYKLHQAAQWKYEETHTRDEFRKRYGKSYL